MYNMDTNKMPIEPMLCESMELSMLDNMNGGIWLYEPKYDGERIVAENGKGDIILWTRRNKMVSAKFPEVIGALKFAMPMDKYWILDGEVTVEGGFEKLLTRNTDDKLKVRIASYVTPATYNVFDILYLGTEEVWKDGLWGRKRLLEFTLKPNKTVKPVPYFVRSPQITPRKLFDRMLEDGFEGMIAKMVSSSYQSKRSSSWLKIKPRDTVDVEVIGATKPDGPIAFGALVLIKNGCYYGKVGTGFTDWMRHAILAKLGVLVGDTDCAMSQAMRPTISRPDSKNIGLVVKEFVKEKYKVPNDVAEEMFVFTNPIPAEILVQEHCKNGSPRFPVFKRMRWQ